MILYLLGSDCTGAAHLHVIATDDEPPRWRSGVSYTPRNSESFRIMVDADILGTGSALIASASFIMASAESLEVYEPSGPIGSPVVTAAELLLQADQVGGEIDLAMTSSLISLESPSVVQVVDVRLYVNTFTMGKALTEIGALTLIPVPEAR